MPGASGAINFEAQRMLLQQPTKAGTRKWAPTFPKNAILKAMLLDLEGAEEAVWVSRFSFKL